MVSICSNAKRNVECVQTNICSLLFKNSLNEFTLLLLASLPLVQRLYSSFICQFAKKPPLFKSVFANDAPIVFSGTATITFFMPWFANLSNPTYINALLLPDAGGAFSSKYLALRLS